MKIMEFSKIVKMIFCIIIITSIIFISSCEEQDSDIFIKDNTVENETAGSDNFTERKLLLVTISEGSSSGHNDYSDQKMYVIKNNSEWISLWGIVYSTLIPQPDIPTINFENEMIIAVFQGNLPSGGYNIRITQILEKENYIEVSVKETIPPEGSTTIAVITSPYHIVKTERTDKEVIFKKYTEFT